MGSICTSEKDDNSQLIIKKTTLDFEKDDFLIDQLLVEKYARAASKIQGRARGLLTRRKIQMLLKLKKGELKDTNVVSKDNEELK